MTQRPRRDEKRAPRAVGVAPVTRLSQQARATLPWVAPQHNALVQPAQLLRASGGGPPPHAIAYYDSPTPPRTAPHRPADASRSVPIAGGENELGLLCAAARAHCRLRARRVVLAETAWVRPWVEPCPCPVAPGQRVAFRTDRRR